MGGEIELDRCEHNISWDAGAAEIVFSSGVPLFVGTWSATRKFVLTPDNCKRIKNLGTPVGDALSECIELWWPHKGDKVGPVMYDIAPILWSYNPHFYSTQPLSIQVETGGATPGKTTIGDGTFNAEVSVDMLAEAARQLWLETICGDKILPA